MKLSSLFVPTNRSVPRDETSTNAQLLLRAGYADKLMAGVYTLLPLGLRVVRNIETIIRQEIEAIGGRELQMPALHPKSAWEPTGRWEKLAPIMYQFRDHGDREVGLGTTHEEILTALVKQGVHSYRDLPLALYQFQLKFRDEPRPKSGLIRLREFVMKDLYSFHTTNADVEQYYETVKQAYERIFQRCGLQALVIEASGGDFTKTNSHEFSVLSPAGEDRVLHCATCRWAQNAEVATAKAGEPCSNGDGDLQESKGIEVGNIFNLGTRFSEAFGLQYTDATGKSQPVHMASYGIGVARTMATIAEVHHDEHGLRWPAAIAPFKAQLIALDEDALAKAAELEEQAGKRGIDVLVDDQARSAGERFAVADLLGLPVRLVISKKTQGKVEWKRRGQADVELLSTSEALKRLEALT